MSRMKGTHRLAVTMGALGLVLLLVGSVVGQTPASLIDTGWCSDVEVSEPSAARE